MRPVPGARRVQRRGVRDRRRGEPDAVFARSTAGQRLLISPRAQTWKSDRPRGHPAPWPDRRGQADGRALPRLSRRAVRCRQPSRPSPGTSVLRVLCSSSRVDERLGSRPSRTSVRHVRGPRPRAPAPGDVQQEELFKPLIGDTVPVLINHDDERVVGLRPRVLRGRVLAGRTLALGALRDHRSTGLATQRPHRGLVRIPHAPRAGHGRLAGGCSEWP